MRFRTMAVAAALMTALAAPAAGSAAGAASGASAAQSQAAPIPSRFRFTFDNGETLAPNSLVRDVTGHRHPGTVLTIDNGSLSVQKDAAGRAAGFPGACKSCGRAIIAVPDAKGLDPGVRPFTFGAWVKVTKAQTQHNSNIVQKGFFHQKGGQWKLHSTAACQLRPLRENRSAQGHLEHRRVRRQVAQRQLQPQPRYARPSG